MPANEVINPSHRVGRPARRRGVEAVLLVASLVAGVMAACAAGAVAFAAAKPSKAQLNCVKSPSSCGYPDATNAGVQAGVSLRAVPGQVSTGPGWHFDPRGWVVVDRAGAVLSGLYIPYPVSVEANNVTINDVKVVVGGPNAIAIALRHVSGVTIENSTISGRDIGNGRMMTGIKDIYGDSAGTRVISDDISRFETGVQIGAGLVQGNFIHDPGHVAGDHTNGVMSNGGVTARLTINLNTILISSGQTDAIGLFEDFGVQQNRTITNNLLAGGGYTIYGGQTSAAATSNIVIQGNRFSSIYFPASGSAGPVAYFDPTGTGNVWSGNYWDNSGQIVVAHAHRR
jgi:hypothetical protein